MKEPYGEGAATHAGPESCAGVREGAGEALTGAHAGQASSREILSLRVPTPWGHAEGNIAGTDIARGQRTRRGQRPCARMEPLCTGTGRSRGRPREDGPWVRGENPKGGRPR